MDPTVVIVFGTLLISFLMSLLYAFWYQQFKYKYKNPKHATEKDTSQSLRVSELEALIRKATAEATQALEERLEMLEDEVTSLHAALEQEDVALKIPEHKDKPLLTLPDDDDEAYARSRPRKRVR